MGRKPLAKKRTDHPIKKQQWVQRMAPLIEHRGITNITTDEIADYLSISKATLYKYFKSKKEMATMLVNYRLEEISHFEAQLMNTQQAYLLRYEKAMKILLKQLAGISNQFLLDLQQHYPELWEAINDFQHYALEVLERFYNEGMLSGILNPMNSKILVVTDEAVLDKIKDPIYLKQRDLTFKQALEQYLMLKLHGMLKTDNQ